MTERFALMNKSLLLDNGVTRNVFLATRPELGEVLWKQIQARNFLVTSEMRRTKQAHVTTHATALMLLEFLGIPMSEIDPIASLDGEISRILCDFSPEHAEKAMAKLIELISRELDRTGQLSHMSLKQKFDHQFGLLSRQGQEFVKAMFGHAIEDEEFRSYVIEILSLDRLQAIEFQKYGLGVDARKELDLVVFQAILACARSSEYEVSFARYLDHVFRHVYETKGARTQIEKRYEPSGDSVDSEIVHLALFGRKMGTSRMPVAVFSTEKIESWKPRIRRYLGALKFLNDSLLDKGEGPIELTPGLIFRVNPSTGILHEKCLNMEREEDLNGFRVTLNDFLRK